jgi:hypothetical protein
MLTSEWRDLLYRLLKKQYSAYGIGNLFDVSRTTHEKILIHLANVIIEEGREERRRGHSRESHATPASKGKLAAATVTAVAFALTFAKYTLLYFFYRCAIGSQCRTGVRSGKTDFVFINSAGGVDRLVGIVEEFVAHDAYRMVYVITSHIGKLIKRYRKRKSLEFIEPQIPGRKALWGGLALLHKRGSGFCLQVSHRLQYRSRLKNLRVVFKIMNYLYAMVIYHHWATDSINRLLAGNNAAIFVFDIDEASKEMMLADALNRKGAHTLLLQHGILTDAKRYIPTCHWMACASDRERQALMSVGVPQNRLFVVGQSLQTLNDSVINGDDDSLCYPLLVLAGNGPAWLQELYVTMLRQSKNLRHLPNAYLRLHPAFRGKTKRLWADIPGIKPTDSGESLGQCLSKAELVITFSIDALIASVRQLRPTVCCVPEEYYVPEWHGFLYDLPGVKVACNAAMLDKFIINREKEFSKSPTLSPEDSAKRNYAFGAPDTIKNLETLLKDLLTGRNGAPLIDLGSDNSR